MSAEWTWPTALGDARAHSRRLRADTRRQLTWARQHRWPIHQLDPHLDTLRNTAGPAPEGGPLPSRATTLAAACRMPRASANRWYREQLLTDAQAERAAFALGLHPANVWTDWYDHDLAAEEVA